jgi:ACR3 family arsenite efflux pump ArsB
MQKVWFKRKRYGFGWTPATWEGWAVLGMYAVLAVLLFRRADASSHSESDTLIGFTLPLLLLTLVLVLVTYLKGETPRWQWGEDDTN